MSHKNFVCSNGMHLSLLAHIGAGCFDGDLDLPLSLDADLESLLLGEFYESYYDMWMETSLEFSLSLEYFLCGADLALCTVFVLLVK